MADRLNPSIMKTLVDKTGKKSSQISPRLSELRRDNSGLTMNAAAQMYAQKHGFSIMGKLNDTDRQSLTTVQRISQVSVTNSSKIDKRTVNIHGSQIHNLSIGDRNKVDQKVEALDSHLEAILEKIEKSRALTKEESADYKSDIQTIAVQAGKTKPDRSIIKKAWKTVSALADVEGFAALIARVAPHIQPFIS